MQEGGGVKWVGRSAGDAVLSSHEELIPRRDYISILGIFFASSTKGVQSRRGVSKLAAPHALTPHAPTPRL